MYGGTYDPEEFDYGEGKTAREYELASKATLVVVLGAFGVSATLFAAWWLFQ